MELHKKAGRAEDVYCGGGYIRRSAEGDLKFKLYSRRRIEASHVFRTSQVECGELLPDEEYYELVANDRRGRRWESKNILASTGGCLGQEGAVTSGMLEEVKHTSEEDTSGVRQSSSLGITFFEDFEIPTNAWTRVETTVAGQRRPPSGSRNVAKFRACGYDFQLSREEGLVNMTVRSSATALPGHLEIRVVEALEFVLARLLQPVVIEKYENGEKSIRLKRAASRPSVWRVQPPIAFRTALVSQHVWKLYERYLTHVLAYEEINKYHVLSAYTKRVIRASAASVEAEALEIGVCVEGILAREFPGAGALSEADIEAMEEARRIIEKSEINDGLRRRMAGAMNSWRQPSATERLQCLVGEGVIDEAEYSAWRKLRHPSTHGRVPAVQDLQEFVDLCHTGTVLLYKLIFRAVGYDGKYTDYSTHGWPLKDCPRPSYSPENSTGEPDSVDDEPSKG
jgi:hypothetical protein